MRWRGGSLLGIILLAQAASAHPGELDECRGHLAQDYFDYGVSATGLPIVPSEPGEYHFHFTPEETRQLQHSLDDYLTIHPEAVRGDYGSFELEGMPYDILEYTRQGEAILRCNSDESGRSVGIARVRREE